MLVSPAPIPALYPIYPWNAPTERTPSVFLQPPGGFADSFQRRPAQNQPFQNAALAPSLAPRALSPLPLNQTAAIRRFAVIGDAGTGGKGQYDVAHMMERVFDQKPYASVLVLGDNVYPSGQPELFEKCIHQPYKGLLDKGVHFYPVLGNHDVKTPDHGEAQLRYWNTPRYYSQRIGNVEIFALDTTLFFPDYDHKLYKNSAQALQEAQKELVWLDKALGASNARFKVVYGHYPLFSDNETTSEMPGLNAQLRNILGPVLTRHQVDVYLGGHTHDYERTAPLPGGMVHFVSGAGGRLREDQNARATAPIQEVDFKRHLLFFEERPEGLVYQAIADNGTVFDSGLIRPKHG